jgi:hypothetical protein
MKRTAAYGLLPTELSNLIPIISGLAAFLPVLSFVGKLLANSVPPGLLWAEAETLRFACRLLRPFTPAELSNHISLSEHRTRVIVRKLIDRKLLEAASGKQRYRTFQLTFQRTRIPGARCELGMKGLLHRGLGTCSNSCHNGY